MTFMLKANRVGFLLLILSAGLALSCRKTPAALPPPPPLASTPAPPPAPAPTITLRASSTTINRGQSLTLDWEARNAATVRIEPEVGEVSATGKRQVSPTSSVNYIATATGPGGTATDVARITVNTPAAPPAATTTPTRPPDVTAEELFKRNLQDVFFDYDKADIRPSEMAKLQMGAAYLKQNPNVRFTIEGHCDERGSAEYNLGLGDRRANAVKEYLASQGVPLSRINTVSYGEERPQCRDETEQCFASNRRAAFAMN